MLPNAKMHNNRCTTHVEKSVQYQKNCILIYNCIWLTVRLKHLGTLATSHRISLMSRSSFRHWWTYSYSPRVDPLQYNRSEKHDLCRNLCYKSVLQICVTNLCYKSVLQICVTNLCYKSVLQICVTNLCYKSVLQICVTNLCYKSVLQICVTNLCYKSVLQKHTRKCPNCDTVQECAHILCCVIWNQE